MKIKQIADEQADKHDSFFAEWILEFTKISNHNEDSEISAPLPLMLP